MDAAAVVLIVAVVALVAALALALLAVIAQLVRISRGLDGAIGAVGEIIEKTAPVNEVVETINAHLDAGVGALEGLLVKKAGMTDALGLIDGLYPGAAAAGLRAFDGSATDEPLRIGEVYTRGVLSLARLGREAPIAAASPDGPVLRDVTRGASAAMFLYPDVRHERPEKLPRSPVIGTNSPVQYPEAERSPDADASAV
jgi:hypothetical protein